MAMNARRRGMTWLVCLALSCTASAGAPPPPPKLDQQVGFDQRLGAQLPLAARFTDRHGRSASLGQWMDGRPTVLAMGYFHCPNLCDAVLQGMAHAVARSGLQPGRDVTVLFVSIDPRERPEDARHAEQMLARMNPQADASRWHFLLGSEDAIHALAGASGYRYLYDARIDQYAHAAGIVVASAGGKVAQYLFGVRYPSRSLRLALVDASQGRVGNVVDQLVLLCCGYDPATGRYSLVIGRVMRWLGCAFALGLIAALLLRRRRAERPEPRT
jgi:protein SCO1/2